MSAKPETGGRAASEGLTTLEAELLVNCGSPDKFDGRLRRHLAKIFRDSGVERRKANTFIEFSRRYFHIQKLRVFLYSLSHNDLGQLIALVNKFLPDQESILESIFYLLFAYNFINGMTHDTEKRFAQIFIDVKNNSLIAQFLHWFQTALANPPANASPYLAWYRFMASELPLLPGQFGLSAAAQPPPHRSERRLSINLKHLYVSPDSKGLCHKSERWYETSAGYSQDHRLVLTAHHDEKLLPVAFVKTYEMPSILILEDLVASTSVFLPQGLLLTCSCKRDVQERVTDRIAKFTGSAWEVNTGKSQQYLIEFEWFPARGIQLTGFDGSGEYVKPSFNQLKALAARFKVALATET